MVPMPRRQLLATALVAGAAMVTRPLVAQTGFNGVITFQSDRSGRQDTFVQYTKGHKVRIDGMGSDGGWMIVDNDAKAMMIVEPRKQQYMTMTQDDARQIQAMMGPMMERMKRRRQEHGAGKLDFTKTGKTESVAGVRCEVWHGAYTDEGGDKDEGDACVAAGVGFALTDLTYNNPMMQPGGVGHDEFERYRQLVGGNKGILKATSTKKGKSRTELEAVKIERKVVDDTLFAPPAGFKEIRMGDMMMKAQKSMQQMPQKTPQAQ
jgi:hypothetical protein